MSSNLICFSPEVSAWVCSLPPPVLDNGLFLFLSPAFERAQRRLTISFCTCTQLPVASGHWEPWTAASTVAAAARLGSWACNSAPPSHLPEALELPLSCKPSCSLSSYPPSFFSPCSLLSPSKPFLLNRIFLGCISYNKKRPGL